MINTYQPNPAQIARLIETDELVRYVVEELGGQITAIRDLQNPPVIGASHPERRKATSWKAMSTLSPLPSRQR